MVTVRVRGGMGNQLFIYAFGYARARESGERLVLDLSSYKSGYFRGYMLDNFNLDDCDITGIRYPDNRLGYKLHKTFLQQRYCYIREKDYPQKTDGISEKDRHRFYFHGFWQNKNFFRGFEEDIARQFTPKSISERVRGFSKEINGRNSVAVHIRRGDYLDIGWGTDGGYYEKAFEYMAASIPKPEFYFFSDDMEWTEKKFGGKPNFHFVSGREGLTDLDEFFAMSECSHNIIANSSFSWWAAWLNRNPGKIVTFPARCKGPVFFRPEGWQLI